MAQLDIKKAEELEEKLDSGLHIGAAGADLGFRELEPVRQPETRLKLLPTVGIHDGVCARFAHALKIDARPARRVHRARVAHVFASAHELGFLSVV